MAEMLLAKARMASSACWPRRCPMAWKQGKSPPELRPARAAGFQVDNRLAGWKIGPSGPPSIQNLGETLVPSVTVVKTACSLLNQKGAKSVSFEWKFELREPFFSSQKGWLSPTRRLDGYTNGAQNRTRPAANKMRTVQLEASWQCEQVKNQLCSLSALLTAIIRNSDWGGSLEERA